MTVHLLAKGYSDDYRVIGVIGENQVQELIDELGTEPNAGFFVQEKPELDTITVVPMLSLSMVLNAEGKILTENETTWKTIKELADAYKCKLDYMMSPTAEAGGLMVTGVDHELVRKTYEDKKAELLSNPETRYTTQSIEVE